MSAAELANGKSSANYTHFHRSSARKEKKGAEIARKAKDRSEVVCLGDSGFKSGFDSGQWPQLIAPLANVCRTSAASNERAASEREMKTTWERLKVIKNKARFQALFSQGSIT